MERSSLLAPLCRCACEQLVTWNKQKHCWNTFLNGHYRKGKKFGPLSAAHKQKIRLSMMGKNKGKTHRKDDVWF
jgi:hypothetical protein